MKRYRAKHRVSKADLKEDRFQQLTERVAEFYYHDPQRFFIIIGVVLVVIVGGILVLQSRTSGPNSEAQLRFTEALGIYTQGQMQDAEEAFKGVASQYGRENVGARAHYYLGQIYYASQRFEDARREYAIFLKGGKKDPVLGAAAALGIANCDEENGNLLGAAEQYEKTYRQYPDSPLAAEAIMNAARTYAEAGAFDRAERVYEELLEGDLSGEQAEEVKVRLSYVRTLQDRF